MNKNSSGSKNVYTPPGTFDSEDKDTGTIIEGSWRREPASNSLISYRRVARNASREAKEVRQEFTEFFATPMGMVPWQNQY
ncbi:hypothetical protein NQ314_021501 [Rhamnusium bicolor]|uniref:Uncharacterized protein n=1 Tax=Rhamnusium bicolor TaxID=1586634 RepID=A0AAV8WIE5_9CUCU|nr:hypothetical protein NQ314_021501 [Rhamnusium bicolor]